MDDTTLMAEALLRRLQTVALEQAEARPVATLSALASGRAAMGSPPTPRDTLRGLEDAWGATATHGGRTLGDLLSGSAAWELLEGVVAARRGREKGPRVQEILSGETLLRIMRDSGELSARESLLRARDSALVALRRDAALAEPERYRFVREIDAQYFADVAALADTYRPQYQEMRRAASAIQQLNAPRVRTLPLLQPPLMARLFGACHAAAGSAAPPGGDSHKARIIVALESAGLLDEMTWDLAAIAVSAFFARTAGNDPEARFPLLIDDYFDWRGVDPRKRTRQLRREIDTRIRFLCSDRLTLETRTDLWLPDPATGRRQKTTVATEGGFLQRRSGLFRPTPWRSEVEDEPLLGHLVSLGTWAHPFVRAHAMVGVFPKKLAEYDLRRQQWERRIGWYLTFQMQNQGAKMAFEKDANDPARLRVTPQHPLRMRTVLQNSHVGWEEMARDNPGKVIRQWVDALETLRRDGILGDYSCPDGAIDGTDLPPRHRLGAMLDRRYAFVPGQEAALRLNRKAARRTAAR